MAQLLQVRGDGLPDVTICQRACPIWRCAQKCQARGLMHFMTSLLPASFTSSCRVATHSDVDCTLQTHSDRHTVVVRSQPVTERAVTLQVKQAATYADTDRGLEKLAAGIAVEIAECPVAPSAKPYVAALCKVVPAHPLLGQTKHSSCCVSSANSRMPCCHIRQTLCRPTVRDGDHKLIIQPRVSELLQFLSCQSTRNNPRPLALSTLRHRSLVFVRVLPQS